MVERIRTLLESRQLTPTQFADVIGVARPIVSHILSGRNKPSLEVVQRILAAMPDLAMPWLLNGTGPMLAGPGAAAGPAVPPEAAPSPAPVAATAAERRPAVAGAATGVEQVPVSGGEPSEQEAVMSALATVAPLRANTAAPRRALGTPKRFVANAAPLAALPPAPTIAPASVQPLAVDIERPPAGAPIQNAAPGPPVSLPPPVAVPVPTVALPPSVPAIDELPGGGLTSALFAEGAKPIRRIVIFYRDGSFADYQPE